VRPQPVPTTTEDAVPALHDLPATDLLTAVGSGKATVTDVVTSCLQRVAEREPVVRAFVTLDVDLVREQASALDDEPARGSTKGPLHGLPVGVKDLVDTADLPTGYGSPIYAGHRAAADAAVVRRLREAGAVLVGKTVTTEFALFQPGPTTNPHDPGRTPGGSSSGSAAAVADRMVAAAIGTQTAASVVRPAAFCGVVGFKPTFGAIDRTGVKLISQTLDTVGLFSRTVADARAVFAALREPDAVADGRPSGSGVPERPPVIGLVRTALWDRAEPYTQQGIEDLAARLGRQGVHVVEPELPVEYDELVQAQTAVMEVEVAQNLARELAEHPEQVSASVRAVAERGRARSAAEYDDALALGADCRRRLAGLLPDVDALLTPAAVGEAPPGLASTGDPVFGRAWTLLHCPAVSLPLLRGPHGLPVAVQLVAPPGGDDRLLDVAEHVTRAAMG
jgi:Asp-tRNA(Asn)/Glu-tRNA(Gln) amidotransferase A subunit family amidase